MDALLLAAASTADPAERESLYQQIGDLYAEDVPTIPLFWEPEFVSYRDGVEGVVVGPPFEFNYNVLSFGADAAPASGNTDTIIIGTTDEVNSLDPAMPMPPMTGKLSKIPVWHCYPTPLVPQNWFPVQQLISLK